MAASDTGPLTYSNVLDAELCHHIDRLAYDLARTWYLDGATDPTMVAGVSLGKAFELVATMMLVRYYRARAVLGARRRTGCRSPSMALARSGNGPRESSAARCPAGTRQRRERLGRARSDGVAANVLVSHGRAPALEILGMAGSHSWDRPVGRCHTSEALRGQRLTLINPQRRALLGGAGMRPRPALQWLADDDTPTEVRA